MNQRDQFNVKCGDQTPDFADFDPSNFNGDPNLKMTNDKAQMSNQA